MVTLWGWGSARTIGRHSVTDDNDVIQRWLEGFNGAARSLAGKAASARAWASSPRLPVPPDYYAAFARWHRLSLMRTPRMLREIAEVAHGADHPERLRNLIALIDDERGYQLYQTVANAKAALSHHETTRLDFRHRDFPVDIELTRRDFETWIAGDLARIAATVDQALASAGLDPTSVDHVILTGGSSFVPAVRALFVDRFGARKLVGGGEFVSVAEGLALIGGDMAG